MKGILSSKLFLLFLLLGSVINSKDISTLSNYEDVKITHLDAQLGIDFDNNIITGELLYTFKAINSGDIIILDSYTLDIKEIKDQSTYNSLNFTIEEVPGKEFLGTALKISRTFTQDEEFFLYIKYETTEESGSAQFLTPEQTEGKKYPYLFTQSEMILGRQLLPIQDTPSIKMSVNMALIVVKPLVALFAGKLHQIIDNGETNTYLYNQTVPIPSYLISFAAGDIKNKTLTENITIYTEEEMLNATVTEFAEIPQFFENCTKYMGEYLWKDYNILVLPKSFPVSGMENPTLNFIAPSLVAGDKSLVDIAVHEMIHSWSGNLVTNSNWADFWLNEGITMFLQRKMVGMWKGTEYTKLDSILGISYIAYCLEDYGEDSNYTSLHPDLSNISPDDIYSDIPYEKGYNFMYYVESVVNNNTLGEDLMQAFFKQYFVDFKYKSLDVDEFKNYFIQYITFRLGEEEATEVLSKIDWDKWIYSPGYPAVENDFSNIYQDEADELLEKFYIPQLDDAFAEKFNSWPTIVKTYFLVAIGENGEILTDEQHKFLGERLNLKNKQNMLISVNYFTSILSVTYKFLEGEEDTLIQFFKDCGQSDYTRGMYYEYYIRNKTGALEIYPILEKLYHIWSFDVVKEEYEEAENDFIFIYMEKFKADKCVDVKANDKIPIEVKGYKETLGEIILSENAYLVKKSDINVAVPLTCHITKDEQYCSPTEELAKNEEYILYYKQSLHTAEYSVPTHKSINSLLTCPGEKKKDEEKGGNTALVVILIIAIIIALAGVGAYLYLKKFKQPGDMPGSVAPEVEKSNELLEREA
ncbi:MAG: M1 family aminopeptidase/hydrolase [archaeon]|nr:M1 family aminopeptidase/hydrolase [archaeon]